MKKFLLAQIVFCAFAFSANSQNLILNPDMNQGSTDWNNGGCTPEIGCSNCTSGFFIFEDSYGGPSATNIVSQVTPDNCMQQTITVNAGTSYKISFDATRRTNCGNGGPGELVPNPGINVKVTGVTSGTVYSSVDYHYSNVTWTGFTNETTQVFSMPGVPPDAQVRLDITAIDNPPVGCGVLIDNISMVVSAILPVNLVSFNAIAKNNTVNLSWVTNNEVNSNYFTVYRSKDGVIFEEVGKLNATGASNGSVYTLTDAHPYAGINYYRLKQTDRSGAFKQSGIVKANLNAKDLNVFVYPTIVTSVLNYVIENPKSEKLRVQVSDITGKSLNNHVEYFGAGTTQKSINTSNLASGVYLLTVTDETNTFKKSITFKKN
ncbi:T9SS type A sorting domain-containing protein [Ferruginibacter sp.]|nr:T9SS type A sorting domain-containing protein [Ferruginibacter sp.]